MMFGNNRIILNQATMQAVVQSWVDAQFKVSPGKVTSVRWANESFEVSIVAADAKLIGAEKQL